MKKFLHDANFDGNQIVADANKVALSVVGATGANALEVNTGASTPQFSWNGTGGTMTGPLTIKLAGVAVSPLLATFGSMDIRSGANNTALGTQAHSNPLISGSHNTALGVGAQAVLTTGSNNVAVGNIAQTALTTGNSNVALGKDAQVALTTGSGNVAVGILAQGALSTGSNNVALGTQTQFRMTVGDHNNAMGHLAQAVLTTGSNNNAMGHLAQTALTTGSNNNALGHLAQGALSTGSGNVAVGNNAQGALGPELAHGTTTGLFTPDPLYCYQIEGSGVRGARPGVWQPPNANPVTITAASGLSVRRFLTPANTMNTVTLGEGAYTTGSNAIAIGGSMSNAAYAAANTVQLLANATTGAKAYLGADRLVPLSEIKAVVASSVDFVDFQAKFAALV